MSGTRAPAYVQNQCSAAAAPVHLSATRRFEAYPARKDSARTDSEEDRVSTDELKGRTKEAAGALTDDDDLKREGKRDQAVGDAKSKMRDVEEWAEDKVDDLRDKVDGDR